MTEMLLKAQNAIGELYLEIGMTEKGLTYFQKAWSNLLRFTLSDLKTSQELMKQKGRRHPRRPLRSSQFREQPQGGGGPGDAKENYPLSTVKVHLSIPARRRPRQNPCKKVDTVAHACDPSAEEAEMAESPRLSGQPASPVSEFEAKERPCHKKQTKKCVWYLRNET